jgi:hypothetical protein
MGDPGMIGDTQNTGAGPAPGVPPEVAQAPRLAVSTGGLGEMTASGSLAFDKAHDDFAAFQEGYVGRYIALADTKAALTFGVASGVIGHLLSQEDLKALLVQPQWSPACVLLGCTLFLLGLSAICAFLVIAPRLKNSGGGLVFFGTVGQRPSADSYVQEVAARSASELTAARLRHCYDVSRVCSVKYGYLRKAMWLALPGIFSALTVL